MMMMNGEEVRIWKEAVTVWRYHLSIHLDRL